MVTGKGSTIASAIKNIASVTGWFPKLTFCNLIIVGNSFSDTNVITVLDYFSRTLRIQDSAILVYSETSAKDLLNTASPLDSISSFALQKVLFKDQGFDKNILTTDIRTFCVNHYKTTSSSFMPIIKTIKQQNEEGEQSSSDKNSALGDTVFDATNTALFKNGILIDYLNSELTSTYAFLSSDVKETVFEVNDVEIDGKTSSHLLTIIDNKPNISFSVDKNGIKINAYLELFCKESDSTTQHFGEGLTENYKIKKEVSKRITDLFQKEIETRCDFMDINEKIYRFFHDYYHLYKNDFYDKISLTVNVNVHGQA